MKPGFDYTGVTLAFYCHDGEGNFVLQKRSIHCRDEQGRWDNGGGKLEFGEDFETGVLRELAEEYGSKGIIEEQLPPLSILRQHEGQATHWVQIGFFVRVERDKVKNNDPEAIDEIGWFRLDDLPKPLHTGFAHSLERHKKYFDKYR